MENKNIADIKGFKKNPRKITEKMFTLLGETIREFGDLSGIVVNGRTGEAVGGNQRTAFFKQNPTECEIVITERLTTPNKQGTVATGYIKFGDEKFAYREVDWDSKTADRANIAANKVGGFWDNDVLANEFDIEDLKYAGFAEFEIPSLDTEEVDNNPMKEWENMPDYESVSRGVKVLVMHFQTEEDVTKFQALIGQPITDKTKYIWFPERAKDKLSEYEFETDESE